MYLASLLPMWVLYRIADFFYVIIFYVIGYRKNVVLENLAIAFPQKTDAERLRIAKNFFHKFTDSMIETIKLISASDSFFEKRLTGNWEVIDQFYPTGRSVQLHMGHNFNWEWGNVILSKNIRYQLLGVYMPISSKPLNTLFKNIRERSGTKMLDAHKMASAFLPFVGKQYCLGLVADQSPPRLNKAKWYYFFNQKTAFTIGPAKNAIRNNAIVIFGFIERPKRGYYHINFSLAEDTPAHTSEQALTKKFVNYLEDIIKKNPDMWLWSHRRWKHEWKEEYGAVIE